MFAKFFLSNFYNIHPDEVEKLPITTYRNGIEVSQIIQRNNLIMNYGNGKQHPVFESSLDKSKRILMQKEENEKRGMC